MKLINKIHIKYFRSLYDIKFDQVSDTLTVFTGSNDIGKSNVLRALNLFFNDETDLDEQILFERDFSKIRRKELKERIKTRQLVQITLEITSPSEYKSLPKLFKVSRNFDRYNEGSDFVFDNKILSDKKKLAAARRLINSIRFTYVPAIKDQNTFAQILQSLKSNLPPLKGGDIKLFNDRLQEYGGDLKKDFIEKLKLEPILSLPGTAKELFSTLDFSIADDIIATPLAQRGDGVRCRFIPSIMNYVAKNSSYRYIWAIEEPENSLEFLKAMELNETLENEYSKNAQILITSHSPAFVGTIGDKSRKIIYFLTRDSTGKVSREKIDRNLLLNEQKLSLSQKLGYIALQKDLADCLNKKITETNKLLKSYEELLQKEKGKQNIVFVEGITDEKYFQCAQRLYSIYGFEIKWVGYDDDKRGNRFSGATALNQLREALVSNPQLVEGKKIILLYDFDSKKIDEDIGDIHIRSTTKNEQNESIKKGIENLLVFPDDFNLKKFYKSHQKIDEYGCQTNWTEFDKMKLCDFLYTLPISEQGQFFQNLKDVLLNLEGIFNGK